MNEFQFVRVPITIRKPAKSFRTAMMDRYNKKTDTNDQNPVNKDSDKNKNDPGVSVPNAILVPAKIIDCKIDYDLRQQFLQRYYNEHKLFWSNVTSVEKTESKLMDECIKIEQDICKVSNDHLKYRSLFAIKFKKLQKLIAFKK